jgi:hypothetical protein
MPPDCATAPPRGAETLRADHRSEPQPALARPWPARQTGSKGRLNFLYPHVEHEGRRVALWDLANHARETGATSLLVQGMGDEVLCGGVLAIEHGLQVYFDYGDGTIAGLKLDFTEPEGVRNVWQICRIRLAPDP